jgi:hypothetical protein
VRHVADTGLFFWGPSTDAYIISVFATAATGTIALLTGIVLLRIDGLS